MIFNFKNGYEKSHFLFEIEDNNNLIKSKIPIYKLENGILNTRYFDTKKVAKIKNYDNNTKQYLSLGVYGGGFSTGCRLFKTNDFFASTLEYEDFEDGLIDYSITDIIIDNFKIIDSTYIFTSYSTNNNRHFSQINIYTNNFDSISNYIFYNKEIANTKVIYCYAQDINNLFYVNQDLSNYNLNFINSTENFQKFDTLYKFQNVTIEKFKQINHFGRKYFAYLTYNSENYNYTIEMFDVLTFEKFTLFEDSDDEINIDNINFDMYQDKIYISFGNKFMKLIGSIENPEWDEYSLPNNGMIDNYMYIQNNFLYCRYEDEKNELNLYRIELVDSLVNSVEINIENEINNFEYVYLYEPYPNPTRGEVYTEVFWSNAININNSEIAVFDLNGNKVSGKENLSLEKLNEWSGNIKWNCTGVPSGTYLIKIQHGNNTKSVKVVVN